VAVSPDSDRVRTGVSRKTEQQDDTKDRIVSAHDVDSAGMKATMKQQNYEGRESLEAKMALD
jgi:hypothetical protein